MRESTHTSPADQGGESDVLADDPVLRLCRASLEYARRRDYTGWDYFDGLSSAIVRWLPFENKWTNLLVQEGVKRAPINIRPYLLVEQRRSYFGAALFAMANCNVYELTGRERYAHEAAELVEWLVAEQIEGYSGFCGGGHRHPIQTLDHPGASSPAETPGVVTAAYASQAFLHYDRLFDDEEYAELARTAADFVVDDLDYTTVHEGARIKYTPEDETVYTINANAIGARLLIDLYDRFGERRLRVAAEALFDYVACKQTATGGWMYRDPPTASHLAMDNYHNGFIIESFLRYLEVTGSDRYELTIDRARNFYRERLFRPNGAPNWDESSSYPRDVHSSAQGIIVFTRLGDLRFARRIVDWTVDSLYGGDGQFYYQKRRFYTKRFTLMRWCQAWMAYALSTYAVERYATD